MIRPPALVLQRDFQNSHPTNFFLTRPRSLIRNGYINIHIYIYINIESMRTKRTTGPETLKQLIKARFDVPSLVQHLDLSCILRAPHFVEARCIIRALVKFVPWPGCKRVLKGPNDNILAARSSSNPESLPSKNQPKN